MPENSYVGVLTPEQCEALQSRLDDGNWEFSTPAYTVFRAKRDKVNVTAYESGKLVVQGKGTQEFIEFILEPEILHALVEKEEPAAEDPESQELHGGIDESGKGDFFGPLCVAGVIVTPETAPQLQALGVRDSKKITSDAQIFRLAAEIRRITGTSHTVMVLKPETYNRLYIQIGNLNRLLAWGHAKTIENLLEIMPECPRMLCDKFGDESLICRALQEKGRQIRLDQRTKAESDIAVAAASILAREAFVRNVQSMEQQCGVPLPKGCSSAVKSAAQAVIEKGGVSLLKRVCKEHFKTFDEVIHGD